MTSLQFVIRSLALSACLSSTLAAQTVNRGLRLVPHDTGKAVELYNDSQALVIGVSRYRNGWEPLSGVPGDCDVFSAALAAHGFADTRVTDPDRDQLMQALDSFRRKQGLNPEARLLVYYAGHGHSLDDEVLGETGYSVPVDAPLPRKDMNGFLGSAVEMSEIESFAKRLRSKHVLFMFDSCFAGTIFAARSASTIPLHINDKATRPVRQFITAGDANETVPDQSIFRRYIVRALEGEGDTNGDGFMTGYDGFGTR
jgi:uncharacterized caspase-like protein